MAGGHWAPRRHGVPWAWRQPGPSPKAAGHEAGAGGRQRARERGEPCQEHHRRRGAGPASRWSPGRGRCGVRRPGQLHGPGSHGPTLCFLLRPQRTGLLPCGRGLRAHGGPHLPVGLEEDTRRRPRMGAERRLLDMLLHRRGGVRLRGRRHRGRAPRLGRGGAHGCAGPRSRALRALRHRAAAPLLAALAGALGFCLVAGPARHLPPGGSDGGPVLRRLLPARGRAWHGSCMAVASSGCGRKHARGG
mmetsp:Transcript_45868/g.146469  ORF Transcript_45868/g.146469 Transcript_45868/m.146469 type:complete len:247 (+) Transcript_45868:274-1014(+)